MPWNVCEKLCITVSIACMTRFQRCYFFIIKLPGQGFLAHVLLYPCEKSRFIGGTAFRAFHVIVNDRVGKSQRTLERFEKINNDLQACVTVRPSELVSVLCPSTHGVAPTPLIPFVPCGFCTLAFPPFVI